MHHAIILAGGAGTRLWPLSRRDRPKQLLRLIDGRSPLELARLRLAGIFAAENTWVVTSQGYLEQVAAALPDLPRENLIGEPEGRDTANAIGLAAQLVAQRDPAAVMAVFTADHLITPLDAFRRAIETGLQAAERDAAALITFGITPTAPHTGYGYVERGPEVAAGVFAVRSFREKPARAAAEEYLRSGNYLWNSGMFAWQLPALLAELQRCLPEHCAALAAAAADWRRPGASGAAARETFARLPKVSIDYGVMERAGRVLTVPMAVDWVDLGAWSAVAATLSPDAEGNVRAAPRTLTIDSRDNLLVSEEDHLLATLGVSDLVVIHAPDATLVCRRSEAERVKEVVERARREYGERYL